MFHLLTPLFLHLLFLSFFESLLRRLQRILVETTVHLQFGHLEESRIQPTSSVLPGLWRPLFPTAEAPSKHFVIRNFTAKSSSNLGCKWQRKFNQCKIITSSSLLSPSNTLLPEVSYYNMSNLKVIARDWKISWTWNSSHWLGMVSQDLSGLSKV